MAKQKKGKLQKLYTIRITRTTITANHHNKALIVQVQHLGVKVLTSLCIVGMHLKSIQSTFTCGK